MVSGPGERWLRLYDWVDLSPVDLSAPSDAGPPGCPAGPAARLRSATATELDGGPPDDWYDGCRRSEAWTEPAKSGAAWAARLAERLGTLPQLGAAVAPARAGELVMCHRDLHPDNVLADPDGDLVVVDWDNLGPATPAASSPACCSTGSATTGSSISMPSGPRSRRMSPRAARAASRARRTSRCCSRPAQLPARSDQRRARPRRGAAAPRLGRAGDRRGAADAADAGPVGRRAQGRARSAAMISEHHDLGAP